MFFPLNGNLCSTLGSVLAGMPYVPSQEVIRVLRLTEPAEIRLQEISFFLVGLLLCAAIIQGLWNWIGRDFAQLPRMSFLRALSIVVLWGLLFLFVLNLIAGARELMTPDAWQRSGATYELRDQP